MFGINSKKYKNKKNKNSENIKPKRNGLFSKNMAMDLGTANTLIYIKDEGLVLQEPSVVAYDINTMEVLAVGTEAKSYIGRTPLNIKVVKPLANGVIEDLEITQAMIRDFFKKVQVIGTFFRPKAVVCVPAGISKVEIKAVKKAASESGIGRLYLIEEPIAAAIGSGLDIDKNRGQMVVNIGGGITDVAVLSLSSIAYTDNIRTGGDSMTRAIINYILSKHTMMVGENSAEQAKISAGSASADQNIKFNVSGKDALTSIPMTVEITPQEIEEAINEPVNEIINGIRVALENTPPEMVTDISEDGIYLSGGGSMLPGIGKAIEKEINIKCNVPEAPLTTVINGTGKILENIKLYKKVFV